MHFFVLSVTAVLLYVTLAHFLNTTHFRVRHYELTMRHASLPCTVPGKCGRQPEATCTRNIRLGDLELAKDVLSRKQITSVQRMLATRIWSCTRAKGGGLRCDYFSAISINITSRGLISLGNATG